MESYKDPVGIWTIGWGHTLGVIPGEKITQGKADAFLIADVQPLMTRIDNMVKAPINNDQFCALLDFSFNLGINVLYHSHLLTNLNSAYSRVTIAREFLKYDHAGGKVLPGLSVRRKAEYDLFLA